MGDTQLILRYWRVDSVSSTPLLRRAYAFEFITLGWNVGGVVVLAIAAWRARSVALTGFGLDSLIEIGASWVVLWELSGRHEARTQRALSLIARAFLAVAAYLLIQGVVALISHHHASHSALGIVWTALSASVMFALAAGKAKTGRALGNPVVVAEGRVTFIDGVLAASILVGLLLNAGLNWWWADPVAGFVIVFYALREARALRTGQSKS